MREIADEILADFIALDHLKSPNPGKYASQTGPREKDAIFALESNLDILNSYFEVAKWQNWADYFDILAIQEDYGKVKDCLAVEIRGLERNWQQEKRNPAAGPAPMVNKEGGLVKSDFESRKEKITQILKETGKIQVGQANTYFPDISKRTLRRDFQKLLKEGTVERIGDKNNTFYKLKIN